MGIMWGTLEGEDQVVASKVSYYRVFLLIT